MARPFSTSALDGGEYSDLCPGCFTLKETAPDTQWTVEWVGPTVSLDAAE
jgi:hypothetical protein